MGCGRLGRHLYRGSNFAFKCISTTLIGAPIYIWSRTAIPPAPPLFVCVLCFVFCFVFVAFFFSRLIRNYTNRAHFLQADVCVCVSVRVSEYVGCIYNIFTIFLLISCMATK